MQQPLENQTSLYLIADLLQFIIFDIL